MLSRATLILIAAFAVLSPSAAQTQTQTHSPEPRSMIRLAAPAQTRPRAAVAELAWLEGRWAGQMPDGPVEIVKMKPAHGHLPTFVRATNKDGLWFYEMAVFVEVNGSLSYRVKHFTPALAGWEAQEAYVDRPLIEKDGNTFYFDGITFSKSSDDSYTVFFLTRNGNKEGTTLVIPFKRLAVAN